MHFSAKTIAFVANGGLHDLAAMSKRIKKYEYIVAVDGGLHFCQKMNILPNLIIGDLDSATLEVLSDYPSVPVRRYLTDKDETDLELAIQSIYNPDIQKMTVFGALEKRTDHTLGNLHLLRRYPQKLFLETEAEIVGCLIGENHLNCEVGQMISLLPLGPAAGIYTEGLKWNLKDATFSKNFMSISNVCLQSTVKITIGSGDLIYCLTRLDASV